MGDVFFLFFFVVFYLPGFGSHTMSSVLLLLCCRGGRGGEYSGQWAEKGIICQTIPLWVICIFHVKYPICTSSERMSHRMTYPMYVVPTYSLVFRQCLCALVVIMIPLQSQFLSHEVCASPDETRKWFVLCSCPASPACDVRLLAT